ncbi:hypothetical protein D9M72_565320 [compost metagenome]
MPYHQRAQQIASGCTFGLGQRQRGRNDWHAGMSEHARGDVVEVQRMACRAVDQRRIVRPGTRTVRQQGAGQIGGAAVGLHEHPDQRLVGCGDGDREPVEHHMAGPFEGRGADCAVAGIAAPFRKQSRDGDLVIGFGFRCLHGRPCAVSACIASRVRCDEY